MLCGLHDSVTVSTDADAGMEAGAARPRQRDGFDQRARG